MGQKQITGPSLANTQLTEHVDKILFHDLQDPSCTREEALAWKFLTEAKLQTLTVTDLKTKYENPYRNGIPEGLVAQVLLRYLRSNTKITSPYALYSEALEKVFGGLHRRRLDDPSATFQLGVYGLELFAHVNRVNNLPCSVVSVTRQFFLQTRAKAPASLFEFDGIPSNLSTVTTNNANNNYPSQQPQPHTSSKTVKVREAGLLEKKFDLVEMKTKQRMDQTIMSCLQRKRKKSHLHHQQRQQQSKRTTATHLGATTRNNAWFNDGHSANTSEGSEDDDDEHGAGAMHARHLSHLNRFNAKEVQKRNEYFKNIAPMDILFLLMHLPQALYRRSNLKEAAQRLDAQQHQQQQEDYLTQSFPLINQSSIDSQHQTFTEHHHNQSNRNSTATAHYSVTGKDEMNSSSMQLFDFLELQNSQQQLNTNPLTAAIHPPWLKKSLHLNSTDSPMEFNLAMGEIDRIINNSNNNINNNNVNNNNNHSDDDDGSIDNNDDGDWKGVSADGRVPLHNLVANNYINNNSTTITAPTSYNSNVRNNTDQAQSTRTVKNMSSGVNSIPKSNNSSNNSSTKHLPHSGTPQQQQNSGVNSFDDLCASFLRQGPFLLSTNERTACLTLDAVPYACLLTPIGRAACRRVLFMLQSQFPRFEGNALLPNLLCLLLCYISEVDAFAICYALISDAQKELEKKQIPASLPLPNLHQTNSQNQHQHHLHSHQNLQPRYTHSQSQDTFLFPTVVDSSGHTTEGQNNNLSTGGCDSSTLTTPHSRFDQNVVAGGDSFVSVNNFVNENTHQINTNNVNVNAINTNTLAPYNSSDIQSMNSISSFNSTISPISLNGVNLHNTTTTTPRTNFINTPTNTQLSNNPTSGILKPPSPPNFVTSATTIQSMNTNTNKEPFFFSSRVSPVSNECVDILMKNTDVPAHIQQQQQQQPPQAWPSFITNRQLMLALVLFTEEQCVRFAPKTMQTLAAFDLTVSPWLAFFLSGGFSYLLPFSLSARINLNLLFEGPLVLVKYCVALLKNAEPFLIAVKKPKEAFLVINGAVRLGFASLPDVTKAAMKLAIPRESYSMELLYRASLLEAHLSSFSLSIIDSHNQQIQQLQNTKRLNRRSFASVSNFATFPNEQHQTASPAIVKSFDLQIPTALQQQQQQLQQHQSPYVQNIVSNTGATSLMNNLNDMNSNVSRKSAIDLRAETIKKRRNMNKVLSLSGGAFFVSIRGTRHRIPRLKAPPSRIMSAKEWFVLWHKLSRQNPQLLSRAPFKVYSSHEDGNTISSLVRAVAMASSLSENELEEMLEFKSASKEELPHHHHHHHHHHTTTKTTATTSTGQTSNFQIMKSSSSSSSSDDDNVTELQKEKEKTCIMMQNKSQERALDLIEERFGGAMSGSAVLMRCVEGTAREVDHAPCVIVVATTCGKRFGIFLPFRVRFGNNKTFFKQHEQTFNQAAVFQLENPVVRKLEKLYEGKRLSKRQKEQFDQFTSGRQWFKRILRKTKPRVSYFPFANDIDNPTNPFVCNIEKDFFQIGLLDAAVVLDGNLSHGSSFSSKSFQSPNLVHNKTRKSSSQLQQSYLYQPSHHRRQDSVASSVKMDHVSEKKEGDDELQPRTSLSVPAISVQSVAFADDNISTKFMSNDNSNLNGPRLANATTRISKSVSLSLSQFSDKDGVGSSSDSSSSGQEDYWENFSTSSLDSQISNEIEQKVRNKNHINNSTVTRNADEEGHDVFPVSARLLASLGKDCEYLQTSELLELVAETSNSDTYLLHPARIDNYVSQLVKEQQQKETREFFTKKLNQQEENTTETNNNHTVDDDHVRTNEICLDTSLNALQSALSMRRKEGSKDDNNRDKPRHRIPKFKNTSIANITQHLPSQHNDMSCITTTTAERGATQQNVFDLKNIPAHRQHMALTENLKSLPSAEIKKRIRLFFHKSLYRSRIHKQVYYPLVNNLIVRRWEKKVIKAELNQKPSRRFTLLEVIRNHWPWFLPRSTCSKTCKDSENDFQVSLVEVFMIR